VLARTIPAMLVVTDRRIIAKDGERLALDVAVEEIRRIQLDVERGRPATLVLVPHRPENEPQVLAVPHEELEAVTRVVNVIGERLRLLD